MQTWNEIVEGRQDAGSLLTDAYRVIRTVELSEGPIGATLARGPDGTVALVAASRLTGWAGWSMRGSHVFSPIDVARSERGHDAVLPWCPHRIDEAWAASAMSGGQAVTLAVSLMRGAVEARRGERGAGAGPDGRWWADEAGRPLFFADLPGEARQGARRGESAAGGAARVLRAVAEGMDDRVVHRLLGRVVEALDEPTRLSREIDAMEAELFEACAPQPLSFGREAEPVDEAGGEPAWDALGLLRSRGAERDASHGGRRLAGRWRDRLTGAREGAEGRRRRRRAGRRRPARPTGGGRRSDVGASIDDVAGEGSARIRLRARMRTGAAHLWAAGRSRSGGRGAAYAAGGAAAVAVLLIGLLWPTGEEPASAEAGDAAPRDAVADGGASGEPARGGSRGGGEQGRDAEPGGDSGRPDVRDRREGDDDGPGEARDDSGGAREAEEDDGREAEENDVGGSGDREHRIEADVHSAPVDAAMSLMRRVAACVDHGDDECSGAVEPGARTLRQSDVSWAEYASGTASLVDDYGGVALVRAERETGDALYLSLALHDDHWLLRDAYAAG